MGMGSSVLGISESFLPFEESIYYRILEEIEYNSGKRSEKFMPEVVHLSILGNNECTSLFHFGNKEGLEKILSENEENSFVQALKEERLPDETVSFFNETYKDGEEKVKDFEHFFSFELPRESKYFFRVFPKPEDVKNAIIQGQFSEEQIRENYKSRLLDVKDLIGKSSALSSLAVGTVAFVYNYNTGFGGLDSFIIAVLTGIFTYGLLQITGLEQANKILELHSKAFIGDGYFNYPIKKAVKSYIDSARKIQEVYTQN